MSRQRSPSYPAISISQAIDLVGKIHKSCRSNIIDRETAAKEMGYSGLTGRSMKVLADLIQFDLLEKAGKGDVKVTQLAVDILHGIEPSVRTQATIDAALAPQLFKDIHDRFPDGIPSENAIRSFLIQQDFMDAAIGPAINAFMETYRAVEHIRESESHCDEADDAPNSAQTNEPETPMQPQPVMATAASAPPPRAFASGVPDLNKINMNIEGDRVLVSGLFDLRGLRALKRKIEGLEALLAPDDDLNAESDEDDDT